MLVILKYPLQIVNVSNFNFDKYWKKKNKQKTWLSDTNVGLKMTIYVKHHTLTATQVVSVKTICSFATSILPKLVDCKMTWTYLQTIKKISFQFADS